MIWGMLQGGRGREGVEGNCLKKKKTTKNKNKNKQTNKRKGKKVKKRKKSEPRIGSDGW